MASLVNDPGGRRRILFINKHNDRKTVRLGKLSLRDAREVKGRIESINAAAIANLALDGDTAKWLTEISDRLYEKLAKVGLVTRREAPGPKPAVMLAAFIDSYIASRTDAKPRTILNLKMFRDRLVAFFGPDRDLTTIKRSEADAWVIDLKANYAPATAGRTIKGARQFFTAAIRAELINRSPLEGIKAGSPADRARKFFVTLEMTYQVLDACPDAEWRLLIALSRFGGLRCPSESLALTWADVDWERDRFRVTSPKTEHHEGKEDRWVPIFGELRPYLQEAWDLADEGTVYVINRYRGNGVNLRTQLGRIIERAALDPWPKLWVNMRATRATELREEHPAHVVNAWIGHSEEVAREHYLQVTEEHFRKAAQKAAHQDPKTAQKAAQHPSRTEHDRNEKTPETSGFSAESAATCGSGNYAWRDSNPQPTAP